MVYSFIANSMLTEDIVIDFVPDTAAPEEGVGVALLNEQMVPLEGLRVAGSPVGQWLKGFADAGPETQVRGLLPHGGNGPEEHLTHAKGTEAPTEN